MNKSLSIGMMARSYIPIPKPDDLVYAPISHMVQLAKGLADKGHHITIFAPVGSELDYPNITIETCDLQPFLTSGVEFDQFLANTPLLAHSLDSLHEWYLAKAMFEQAQQGNFDLLHFHYPESGLPLAKFYPKIPVLYTLHDPVKPLMIQTYQLHLSSNQGFIAISHQQARHAEGLPIKATIHHGIDLPPLDPTIRPEQNLLFVGRIIPEKGVKEAIQVAQRSSRELVIIGPTLPASQAYFDQEIAPHLNHQIRYLGQLEQPELTPHYQRAAALLTPIQWDEPFGLTTIESMAHGTPVISLNRGAAPEIIVDRQTGFLANNLKEMVKAVDKIPTISRQKCRQHVQNNFSFTKTINATESIFRKAVQSKPTE